MTIQTEEVARIVDPAPFGRQDKNWNGKGSPLWQHYNYTDIRRIITATNRAQAIVDLLDDCERGK